MSRIHADPSDGNKHYLEYFAKKLGVGMHCVSFFALYGCVLVRVGSRGEASISPLQDNPTTNFWR